MSIGADIEGRCPLCAHNWPNDPVKCHISYERHTDGYLAECERCGHYVISMELQDDGPSTRESELFKYLSCYTRQAGKRPVLTLTNWKDFAQLHSTSGVEAKVTKALQVVAAGASTIRLSEDHPLLDSVSVEEAYEIVNYLAELDWAKVNVMSGVATVALTFAGRREAEGLGVSKGAFRTAVIAMSFDGNTDDIYATGIKPALERCGCTPIRLDEVSHNGDFSERMLIEIRKCRFLVADFSAQNNGVYFEAGYALGLGKPVIFTCPKDQLEHAHADTRNYQHVAYSDPKELNEKLTGRIQATILGVDELADT